MGNNPSKETVVKNNKTATTTKGGKTGTTTKGGKTVTTTKGGKTGTTTPKTGTTTPKTGTTTPKTGTTTPKKKFDADFKYYNQLNKSDSTMMAGKAAEKLKQYKQETVYVKSDNPRVTGGIRADRTYIGTDPATGRKISVTGAERKSKYPKIKDWKEGKPSMVTFSGNFKK